MTMVATTYETSPIFKGGEIELVCQNFCLARTGLEGEWERLREKALGVLMASLNPRECVTRWRGKISILGLDQSNGKEGVLIGNESDERIAGLMSGGLLKEITELKEGSSSSCGISGRKEE